MYTVLNEIDSSFFISDRVRTKQTISVARFAEAVLHRDVMANFNPKYIFFGN